MFYVILLSIYRVLVLCMLIDDSSDDSGSADDDDDYCDGSVGGGAYFYEVLCWEQICTHNTWCTYICMLICLYWCYIIVITTDDLW